MAISTDGATTYFQNHMKAEIWAMAASALQAAAIAHARRVLARALGRALSDTEAAYAEGDTTRDEYAVYEQALYLIENGIVSNGEGSAPQPLLVGDADQPNTPRKGQHDIYAPEALRWLGYRGAVVVQG